MSGVCAPDYIPKTSIDCGKAYMRVQFQNLSMQFFCSEEMSQAFNLSIDYLFLLGVSSSDHYSGTYILTTTITKIPRTIMANWMPDRLGFVSWCSSGIKSAAAM